MKPYFAQLLALMLLGSLPASAAMITFGVDGGILGNGEIDLGILNEDGDGDVTYVNPAGAGFDIRISGNQGTGSFSPEDPAGTAKTNGGTDPVITIDFFATGTTTAVEVTGFAITFGDIDSGSSVPLGNFVTTQGGVSNPLSLTGLMTPGSSLTISDQDGDTVFDDISSSLNVGGNEFGDARINAFLDMGSIAISSISFTTQDFVHFGNSDVANMTLVPEPSAAMLTVLGLLAMIRRRR